MNETELRTAFAALPEIDPNAPYHTWPRHRYEVRRHVAGDDPRNMLQWSTICATMFVGNGAAFTPMELSRLTNRYLNVIGEPRVGNPPLYDGWTSGNLIHQAYHIMQWEKETGLRVSGLNEIVELGGGYGALAMLCRRLGFKGRYYLADLPEFLLLQEYYLTNVGIHDVDYVPIDGLEGEPDLLIGIYSLTEMEIEQRWQLLDDLRAKHVLIKHQRVFAPFLQAIDNVAWSLELVQRYPANWRRYRSDLPSLEDHWYVIR